MTMLAAALIDDFQLQGAVVLRGMFVDWVDTLRAGIDFNMTHPGATGRFYRSEQGGRFLTDYCNWRRIDEYRRFIFKSGVTSLARQLMASRQVQLFHEHVLVKEAQTYIATPWHQDQPYYCVRCAQTISFWIPLDEIPRDRTLEFVAGSHQWGKLYRPERFNGEALNAHDGMETVPDIDGTRDNYEILGWALSPGDAVAFDYRMIHGAPPNRSASAMRRAFSLRLLGDDAIFQRKAGIATSPPFPDVTLNDGDRLCGDDFPILYGDGAAI